MDQRKIYNDKVIYDDYAGRDYLFKPEQQIIRDLSPYLGEMRMLDMGVGGGRTTKYFAPLVRSYLGADYAVNMVQVCHEKFGHAFPFMECDARDMKDFQSDSFDLVLFSYNGIDSFGHADRKAALREIHRVLRHDGIFCFSSHNLGWEGLYDLFRIRGRDKAMTNLMEGFNRSYRMARLHVLNRSLYMKDYIDRLREKGHGMLYDDSLQGRAVIYYITYQEQARQLKEAGFDLTATYCTQGLRTDDEKELNKGGWVYYLCSAKKHG